MKHHLIIAAILFAAGSIVTLPTQADPKIKQGTWEMAVSMEGLPIPIPPTKTRYCVSKTNYVPKDERQEQDCKIKWKSTGNTVDWTMNCQSGGRGKARIVYNWDRMSGHQELHIPGSPQPMKSKMQGRWISADCKK
jgi:hypothetical protein